VVWASRSRERLWKCPSGKQSSLRPQTSPLPNAEARMPLHGQKPPLRGPSDWPVRPWRPGPGAALLGRGKLAGATKRAAPKSGPVVVVEGLSFNPEAGLGNGRNVRTMQIDGVADLILDLSVSQLGCVLLVHYQFPFQPDQAARLAIFAIVPRLHPVRKLIRRRAAPCHSKPSTT